MKLLFTLTTLLGVCLGAFAEDAKPTTTTNDTQVTREAILKDKTAKISYAMGVDVGSSMKKEGVKIDPEMIFKGLKDSYSGKGSLLTEAEVHEIKEALGEELENAAKQNELKRVEALRADGEFFLAENKKKKGVVTLPSGLQYMVIKDGTGEQPKATDTVLLHYTGKFVDGVEFDNSYKRNVPNTVPLGIVIKGWSEAVQLMKVGSKWEVVLPANLAYGARGAEHSRGRQIPPFAVLIYEMELVGIKK